MYSSHRQKAAHLGRVWYQRKKDRRTVITSLVAYFCSCSSAQLFGSSCLYCGAGCAVSIVLPSSVGQVAEFGRCFAAAGSLSSGRQGSSGQRRISTPLPRRSPSRAAGVGVYTLAVLARDLTTEYRDLVVPACGSMHSTDWRCHKRTLHFGPWQDPTAPACAAQPPTSLWCRTNSS